MHKQIAKGKLCIEQVLCDKRERWDLVGGGREVLGQEGGDMWISMAESCRRMAETNTTL